MRKVLLARLLVLTAFACALAPCAPAAAPFEEYQVKAVYLFNFARFVDWPPEVFRDAAQPMTICVVGSDPFAGYLRDAIRDEQVEGRSLALREVRRDEPIDHCNLAFVSRSETGHFDTVLAQAAKQHVLTVSDIPDFVRAGGAIGFETRESHVRIQLNMDAAHAAGLTISSKLVRIASVVVPS